LCAPSIKLLGRRAGEADSPAELWASGRLQWVCSHQGSTEGRTFPGKGLLGGGFKTLDDPSPGVRGVDDCVDFQVGGHIHGLTPFVKLRDQLIVKLASGRFILDGGQFFFETSLDGAVDPHGSEFAGRPRRSKKSFVKSAPGHGHDAKAVAPPEHQAEKRHGEVGAYDKHPADVAHLGAFFHVRPHHRHQVALIYLRKFLLVI